MLSPLAPIVIAAFGLTACGGSDVVTASHRDAGADASTLDAASPDGVDTPREGGDAPGAALLDARVPEGTRVCGLVTDKVDLLFVIDNSGSMAEEQALLTAELPRMVYALGSGDLDGDGEAEFRPADLHIGVVSTDMGADLGPGDRTCTLFGSDGMLVSGCSDATGAFTTYAPSKTAREPAPSDTGPSDAAPSDASVADQVIAQDPALQRALGCLVDLGTSGCGFESPLEAALKALTPSTDARVFQRGTGGHGDGENAGFFCGATPCSRS